MDNLYNLILAGLQKSNRAQSLDKNFANYLRSLQTPVKQLRQSYRSDLVTVDYSSEEIQAAYLIAYYPQYAEMTKQVLEQANHLHNNLFLLEQKYLNICLFGAGAAPEVVGLVSFLSVHYPKLQSLNIRVYDIFADTWTFSQQITRDIIDQLWQGKIEFSTHLVDFCQFESFKDLKEVISDSQLFIFQNCLNEIRDFKDFNQNIRYLLEIMPSNALLIMSDLKNYKKVGNFQIQLKDIIQQVDFDANCLCLRYHEMYEFKSKLDIPKIILENLLIGIPRDIYQNTDRRFLVPRRNISLSFLSIYKTYKYEVISNLLKQSNLLNQSLLSIKNLQEQENYNLKHQIKVLKLGLMATAIVVLLMLIFMIFY